MAVVIGKERMRATAKLPFVENIKEAMPRRITYQDPPVYQPLRQATL